MNLSASILVVDDHPESLALLAHLLSSEGYSVRAADSGDLALASVETGAPDLIVLDVHMEGIDGFEVCRRLKASPRTQDIPIILISAFTETREWMRGLQLGAADYLAKPFQPDELITRVKTHIAMSWANQAMQRQTDSLRAEILHRQRIEAELREREVQYQNLADSGVALVWTAGLDKGCYYFNLPWLRFTGRTLEQEKGNGWVQGVHPDDLERCFTTYVAAFDRREPFEMEYRLRHHSGEYRWILDLGTPNYNSRGEFVGYIGHCIDITEKIKYQEALQRNDKLDSLGILAGGIAHDFNNLLAGLFAYLSLAREASAPDSKPAHYLDKALTAFDRAKDLTRQLLTFAKGGAPERKPGDLGPFLREAAGFALSGANAVCEFDIAPDLQPANFDANQIGQVIDNLIINALQAMPDGGKIVVSAHNVTLHEGDHPRLKPGPYVEVRVADTGNGIAPNALVHVFDPFFSTKPKGNGLGLPTCHSILQRHDGAIDVESSSPQGTVFRVLLPCSEALPASAEPEVEASHCGDGAVLVLDDEELLRDLTGVWLGEMGYTVVSVADGDQALVQLAGSPCDGSRWVAALFDLTVPGGKGGKETVAALRQAHSELPVFATSGYSEDPVMSRPTEFGFTASLRKPFLKDELAALLDHHLGRSL